RVALGAPGWRVAAVVLSDTLACVGVGLAAGLVLALGAASAIRSYLFRVEPRDSATLAVACALVVAAALLAAYLPARRAPRVDPITALRAE
ncbi:MAG TPA: FtsX-like permease family protein, partial [Vicinamibacterales bacterium]|nr:FtsX-like permease family protein [Vicinamibacterales bacterium]